MALTVDPGTAALKARMAEVREQRAAGQPSVPSLMSNECAANPFLLAKDVASLADVRGKKDRF